MNVNFGSEKWGLFYAIDRPSVLGVEKHLNLIYCVVTNPNICHLI